MIESQISIFDLKRLESYSRNLVDFHLIMDLVPTIAKLYFSVLPEGTITLSYVQVALLVGMGLQFKTIDQLQGELRLQANQLLPVFNKAIRKFTKLFRSAYQADIEEVIAAEERIETANLGTMLASVKDNKQANAVDADLHQSLADELAGQGAGTKMAAELNQKKQEFLARHKIKEH